MAIDGPPNLPESQPESASGLTRRERRKLEMRARILESARALFADQSFQETRVADVCDRADIAQKTFFNHFPTKLDLLREIAHTGIEQLMFDIEDIRKARLGTRDRLMRFFETVSEQMTESGPRNRELLVELVHLISGDAAERSDQVRRLHAGFRGIVEDGLALGDVTRRHDPQALTELILGSYYVLIFNYANLEDFPVRERANAAARVLADALAPQSEEHHGDS
jgi:AcrR family transcriptional regulator